MIRLLARKAVRAAYLATTWGLDKGASVTRYTMYEHLSQYREDRSKNQRCLSISHSERLASLLGYSDSQIEDVSFPEVTIVSLPFGEGTFDAVVSDQVLEHVEADPFAAIKEAFRVLKPGGVGLHTTCFVNPLHESPVDLWRFSPAALRLLVSGHAETIDFGGWGNPYVWPFSWLGLRYVPIPHATWHPAHWLATKSSGKWMISTWILARKPAMHHT